jgi:DNA-binding transcriptional regulator GbsR (MarR family)
MPTGHTIDHNDFHAFLYAKADRMGRIKMKQTALAEELGITKYTVSRTISKMLEDKRMRQISRKGNNRGYFVVEDPDIWRDAHGQ